jgi:hypothetical protein
MRAIIRCGGGLLGLLLLTSVSTAYPPWCNPLTQQPYPTAPDACGYGFYVVGPYGMVYGPNYYLVPPFRPVGTCLPTNYQGQQPNIPGRAPLSLPVLGGPPGAVQPMPVFNTQMGKIEFPSPGPAAQKQLYPTHPFVRGPRDFFMWSESMEEQEGRNSRPALVP